MASGFCREEEGAGKSAGPWEPLGDIVAFGIHSCCRVLPYTWEPKLQNHVTGPEKIKHRYVPRYFFIQDRWWTYKNNYSIDRLFYHCKLAMCVNFIRNQSKCALCHPSARHPLIKGARCKMVRFLAFLLASGTGYRNTIAAVGDSSICAVWHGWGNPSCSHLAILGSPAEPQWFRQWSQIAVFIQGLRFSLFSGQVELKKKICMTNFSSK